ncbi:hypothetical protein C8F01DRAFT_1067522 [Mycena amicta]|nr:hypothetical protein C8F01DRAFT_1067522 [Mycena amicta]
MQQDDSKLMNLLSLDDVVEVLRHRSSGPETYLAAHPQIPMIHLGAVYHHARRSSTYTTMKATEKIFSFPVAISEMVDEWDSTEFLQHIDGSPYLRVQDVRDTMSIFLQPHIKTELCRRWITQANSLVPGMEDMESSAEEEFFLATKLVVDYKMVFPDCDITLQGTFMADEVPTEELYLFIKPLRKYIDNGVLTIELPFDPVTGHLAYFWSVHPDGREPLDQADLDIYCPPHIKTEIEVLGAWWKKEDYKIIADVMRREGYDPTTTDYAREHGIPEPIFHTSTEHKLVGTLSLSLKHTDHHMQN